MDDLIFRKAAIEICKSIVPNTNPDFYNLRSKKGYGCWMHSNGEAVASTSIQVRIKELPAVDVAPVVHGQWKAYCVPHWTKRYDDNGDPEYKYHDEYVCSICRRRTIIKENYCPHCGAKMDGDGDG